MSTSVDSELEADSSRVESTDAPPMVDDVLVVDTAGTIPRILSDALADDPTLQVVACSDPVELADHLDISIPRVLVAGPGMGDPAGFERLRVITDALPQIGIILALEPEEASAMGIDLAAAPGLAAAELVHPSRGIAEMAAAVRVVAGRPARGQDHREAEPADEANEDVTAEDAEAEAVAFGVPLRRPMVRGRGGSRSRVIVVTSGSGGSGKTSIATNLAWFLRRHGGRRSCIIDLDIGFGDVATALRLEAPKTIAEALTQTSDGAQLARTVAERAIEHLSGVSVLASPADPLLVDRVPTGATISLVEAARSMFDDVIVDLPAGLDHRSIDVIRSADVVHVLATLDVPSLRNMRILIEQLRALGVTDDILRLIITKAETGNGVELAQLERLIPQRIEATFPLDREVPRSMNLGSPVLESAPSSSIGEAMNNAFAPLLPAEARAGLPTPNQPRRLLRRRRHPQDDQ